MNDLIRKFPPILLDAIKSGNCILFLGAGASHGATHTNNQLVPKGNQLRDMLCDKFLGGSLKNRSLAEVASFCESEAGTLQFNAYIREVFEGYGPAEFHKIIAKFKWHAIVTTNFDLIIERTYQSVSTRMQTPIPHFKNNQQIEVEAKKHTHPLPLVKLHGCIDHIEDGNVPFILTPSQYASYMKNRHRLFDRLRDWAHEMPIIFCGYSLADANIQTVLFDLMDKNITRPNYYSVTPNVDRIEERALQKARITALDMTFSDFLEAIDSLIPPATRILSTLANNQNLSTAKFFTTTEKPSSTLENFIKDDVWHVYSDMPVDQTNAKDYYKGLDFGFGAIAANLDVRRNLTDTVLSDFVLVEENENRSAVELVVLKGPAGNGKTNLLKRIAWDAAANYDALALFVKEAGSIRSDALIELANKTGRRIFLFVDKAALNADEIQHCLYRCNKLNVKLTLITAERDNEWNSRCESLDQWLTTEYSVHYLAEREVHGLLEKLELNNSLGLLQEKTYQQRVDAFLHRARRQLLVALHEATLGQPFEEI